MRGPRLIYVLPKPDFFAAGGRGRVTHALGICEGFLENDWDVSVISGPAAGEHWFSPAGISEISVQPGADVKTRFGAVGQALWLRRVHRLIVEQVSATERPVVLIRYTFRWLPWLGQIAAVLTRAGIYSVIEVNSFGYHMVAGRLPEFVRRGLLKMETFVTSSYDLTYVVSPELERLLRGSGYQAPVITVPNGVSSRLALGPDLNKPRRGHQQRPHRCVYFGTFQPYYDFEILFDAYRRLKTQASGLELHLYGSGSEEERIRKLSRNADDVFLHGRYEISQLLEWLDAGTDILVLPPKKEYDVALSGGLSTKLFEYMAMGLPLVASTQVSGVLQEGKHALLYDPCRPGQLADRIRSLLDDPDLARNLGRTLRQTVLEKHTWRARCQRLIDVLPCSIDSVE